MSDYYEEVTLKNIALKELVKEAIQLLQTDLTALRDGVSINGNLSTDPVDAETIKEINRIELWMALAKIELGRNTQ